MQTHELIKMCLSTTWDGIDRLSMLSDTFHVVEGTNDQARENAKKWLIQCCAAWDYNKNNPHVPKKNNFEYLLLLIGIDPELGNQMFRSILPMEFNKYQTHIPFDPMNKRSIIDAIDYSLVILTGFNLDCGVVTSRDYIDFLNITLSREVDGHRRKFGKFWKNRKRRTVFGGTVEDPRVLVNLTNDTRRFLPIYLLDIDLEKLKSIDKYQFWAQIWVMYINGI